MILKPLNLMNLKPTMAMEKCLSMRCSASNGEKTKDMGMSNRTEEKFGKGRKFIGWVAF